MSRRVITDPVEAVEALVATMEPPATPAPQVSQLQRQLADLNVQIATAEAFLREMRADREQLESDIERGLAHLSLVRP